MRGNPKLPRPSAPFVCKTCGTVEDAAAWANRKQLEQAQLCQGCLAWTARLQDRDDQASARICGILYVIGPENEEQISVRGHQGRQFVIHFSDGRKVTTRNLWYVGPIPHRFRQQLPDNATWGENP